MKKTLPDIDVALTAQHVDHHRVKLLILQEVRLDMKRKILTVDDTMYKLTSGLLELITNKHPRPDQYNLNDKKVYR